MMFLQVLIVMWVLSAILSAGILVAFFQNEYLYIAKENYKEDLVYGVLMGVIGGPITLYIGFYISQSAKHGWSLKKNKNVK